MNDINPNFHKLVHYYNPDIEIELAKPNKIVVGNLTEAYNIKLNMNSNQINELTFSIPYTVEKNYVFVENKNVNKIKQRYLLKIKYLDIEEYMIIIDETDSLNDTNVKHVTAYSLGYQLSDKYIRQWAGVYINNEYRKESLNAKQVMDSVLSETNWNYDDVNSDTLFLTRYRSFDFQNQYRLDAVFNIAETFNAIIEWDTKNRKVIFKDADTYGGFRGLYISDEKYLSSYERNSKANEMSTRLYLYGKDGLTVNEVNPSGTAYIEDLSFFLKGFSMDSNGVVLSHSTHAEDELCMAIIKYQNLIISKDGEFKALLVQKEALQLDLKARENELFNLKNELKAIQVEIDFADSQGKDSTAFKTQEANKKVEINSKELSITNIKSSIANVNSQMVNLKNEIATENNFTPAQIEELNNFIIEKTWENDNISDAKELLALGVKEIEKINKPNTVYDIGLVNLLSIAEAQKDVKKLKLGDKIRIYKKETQEEVEAQIIEISIDFDGKGLQLVLANFSTNKNDEQELVKLIYKNNVATSTVNMNKSKWDDIGNVGGLVEGILNNAWDSAKTEIESGAEQSVIIDNRGITTFDIPNPNKFVRIMGGIIGLTTTGGKNFKTAITGSHIVAEVIAGRLIIGQELIMENEAGKFTFNQDGVTIKNTAFNLTSDSSGISNGVTINSQDGIVITKSDNKVKTILNSTDGIKIQVKKGNTWNNAFYYDVINESLTVDGLINARDLKVNGQSVLMNNNTMINGTYVRNISADSITAGKIKADFIDTKGLITEELKSIDQGNIIAHIYSNVLGGKLLLNLPSGRKSIEFSSSISGGGTGVVDLYDAYEYNTIKINQNGLFVNNRNGASPQLVQLIYDFNNNGYLNLKASNGSDIFTASNSSISYKGQPLATQEWVLSQIK